MSLPRESARTSDGVRAAAVLTAEWFRSTWRVFHGRVKDMATTTTTRPAHSARVAAETATDIALAKLIGPFLEVDALDTDDNADGTEDTPEYDAYQARWGR